MKFIHCADVHLGAPILRYSAEKARVRRGEVLSAFLKMLRYARENGIRVVALCGDVFDSNMPLRRDREVFYQAVRENADVTFLYLKGNHDQGEGERFPNLLTFGEEPLSYRVGDTVFTGVELNESNALSFQSALRFKEEDKNVLMLHAEAGGAQGAQKIRVASLKNKNIDYLALGHIHRYYEGRVDERGVYVNPGCLEGRGFDECGEKGFVVVDTQDFSHTFIVNSIRVIREESLDITGVTGEYQALERVRTFLEGVKEDILRLVLTGTVEFDTDELESFIWREVKDDRFYLEVKNATLRAIDPKTYMGDVSLRGEFLRVVSGDERLTEEEKARIMSIGLKLTAGKDI